MLSKFFQILKGKVIPIFSGFILMGFSIVTALSLATYSPSDPSWSHYIEIGQINNIAGKLGANLADIILQKIGYSAFLPIIFLLVIALKFIYRTKFYYIILRISLLIWLTIIAAIAFSSHNCIDLPLASCGGYVGEFLKDEISEYLPEATIYYYCLAIFGSLFLLCIPLNWNEWKIIFKAFITFIYNIFTKTIVLCVFLFNSIGDFLKRFAKDEKLNEHINQIKINPIKLPIQQSNNDIEDNYLIAEEDTTTSAHPPIEQKSHDFSVEKAQNKIQSSQHFTLPDYQLLQNACQQHITLTAGELEENAVALSKVLADFGIKGEISSIRPGPVVTLYELKPAAGTKSSRVIGLADDIARSMSAVSARIAVIPGKNALGIELPNEKRLIVYLREILESAAYHNDKLQLPLVLGKDIGGDPIIADLAKMPHLLVAGTTGSGKSVAINTMILSLIYRLSPKECRFIMIDPKMLELSVYDGIPHLLSPVVTNPKAAISALRWVVAEMERRYKSMSILGVRNIHGYNKLVEMSIEKGEALKKSVQVGFDSETGQPIYDNIEFGDEKLPFIVVIVDEMADLMLVAGKDIESYIQRLSQMARAAGIHLVMATQRPSVDVITGVIKANFPTRISFQVTSKIDSRTILGEQGAEQLLGMGDMLYMAGGGKITRVHGPFVSDKEVIAIVKHLKSQGVPEYVNEVTATDEDENSPIDSAMSLDSFGGNDAEDLYKKAVEIVLKDRRASTSYVQRCLKIGYNKAANLIEKMEKEGVLSAPNHQGKREILIE